MRIVECSACHQNKPYHGKGMCGICYRHWNYKKRPYVECVNCHETKRYAARGMCQPCYRSSKCLIIGPRRNPVWTAGRIDEVQSMLDAGLCTREIGERMGVTKNMIIGVCWRNHLTDCSHTSTTAERFAAMEAALAEVMAIQVERLPATAQEKRWLRSLERMVRFG